MRHLLSALLLFAMPVAAKTYQVGPQREMKSLKAIAPKLQAGDVVEIDPGIYREVFKLQANGSKEAPIIVRGVGETRPVFDAEGLDTSGRGANPRAILQIEGANLVIERLEFKNARNGHNAAGIRLNDSTNAIIRDCKITQCDMGVFGGDKETALIEKCEVAFNSTEKFNGYSHNFYMHGNRVVVRGCYIHDATYGQNFKSRAHYNELWFNWISDSKEGEVGFVDGKGATDKPHSNALMVGNIVVSKKGRTGNTLKFIDFGSDGGNAHDGTLYLFYNTLIAGEGSIKFLMLSSPGVRVVAANNIYIGSTQMTYHLKPLGAVITENGFTSGDVQFIDKQKRDFRLKPTSPAARGAVQNLEYKDENGFTLPLKIEQQYKSHLQLEARRSTQSSGAFEVEK